MGQASSSHAYAVGNAFIFLEKDIDQFERNPTGRKRKGPPSWRIYKGDVKVLITEITVQVHAGQQEQLTGKSAGNARGR